MQRLECVKVTRRAAMRALALATAGAALAACAPQTPSPAQVEPTKAEVKATEAATAAPAPAGGVVKLRYYVNADPTRNKWAQDVLIPDYKQAKPDVEVELIIVPWDEFDPKLTSMFAAGDLPEIWGNWGSTGYAEYALRGMCIYQQEYIDRDRDALQLDDFPKTALEGVTVQGKLVGLPIYNLGTYVYYNRDVFQNEGVAFPPSDWEDTSWTWDTLLEVATKLTKNYDDPATGQYGITTSLAFEDICWLFGADLWAPDVTKTSIAKTINFDKPDVIDAFQKVYDLVCKHKVAPDAAISSALSAAGDPFQAGKVGMILSAGWTFWGLKDAGGDFNWSVAALPHGPKGPAKASLYADPMLISAQTKLKDEAWGLVSFINAVENLRKFVVATWSEPSRLSLLPDFANLWPEDIRPDMMKALEGSWKYGEVTPWNRIAGYSQFYDTINNELSPAAGCDKTVAEVAPIIKQKVEEILAGLSF